MSAVASIVTIVTVMSIVAIVAIVSIMPVTITIIGAGWWPVVAVIAFAVDVAIAIARTIIIIDGDIAARRGRRVVIATVII
jgi:hypothetical protein